MDLSKIWQENKRFITTVGAGLLVFFIGLGALYIGINRLLGKLLPSPIEG